MKKTYPLLFALLLILLAACTPPPPAAEELVSGGELEVTLPPSKAVYLRLTGASGPTQVAASDEAPLRLVLLNPDLNPMLASVSSTWFGLPQVAVAIAVEPLASGPRLNFEAYPGHAYYLRVENLSHTEATVTLSAKAFDPNPKGDDDPLEPGEPLSGAIEFLNEVDTYITKGEGYLRLEASGSGVAWLTADVYEARAAGSPKVAGLEPGDERCVPAGAYVMVRTRGNQAAGFDEPESLRYTLTLTSASCP